MSKSPEILREFFRALLIENIDLVREVVAGEMSAPAKDAYSVPEVAEKTGLSQATIRRRVKAGIIPVVPGLNPARVPSDFVTRMMNGA
jgi:hypothetical protein